MHWRPLSPMPSDFANVWQFSISGPAAVVRARDLRSMRNAM
ncbi:hypothetical protein Pd630_LPD16102 (plasmid) [Rhodococcus opacus PD630]|nr:hypothetical protein Pd630_LPD16102 [Rhodococcus opacus PD630]